MVAERCWIFCLTCPSGDRDGELRVSERFVELVGGRDAKSRVEDSFRLSLRVSGGQRQLNCGNSLNSRLWRAIRLGPNGRRSALQQQVNALMAQNATLEAQLLGQQNIAQGLAELPGATTTVLNRAQAPTQSRPC